MCEELLVEQCAPTMAGLKTGSLSTCPKEDQAELLAGIRTLNARLVPKGLRILPVKTVGDRELIYLYRPARLRRDLQDALAAELLAERHYPAGDANRCVAELVRRLSRGTDFPHEVGLFLGYLPGMWRASSGKRPAAPSVREPGRSTATRKSPGRPSPSTSAAPGPVGTITSATAPWSG